MEEYKIIPIDKFDNLYKASNMGNIINTITNKTLKQKINNGYKNVHLYNRKTKYCSTLSVNVLVALAFLPNPQNYNRVNHKNGDKLDNRVNNLEWVTQKENINHALSTGLLIPHKRKVSKYNSDGEFVKNYESVEEGATEHNITRHAIIKACKNKSKSSAGYIWKYVYGDDSDLDENSKYIEGGYNYKVSKCGKIYSLTTKKNLKPMRNKSGYEYVTLVKNGKKKNFYIHVLVANAFLIKKNSRYEVNHKNKIKHDNCVDNLEWVTRSENMVHAYST